MPSTSTQIVCTTRPLGPSHAQSASPRSRPSTRQCLASCSRSPLTGKTVLWATRHSGPHDWSGSGIGTVARFPGRPGTTDHRRCCDGAWVTAPRARSWSAPRPPRWRPAAVRPRAVRGRRGCCCLPPAPAAVTSWRERGCTEVAARAMAGACVAERRTTERDTSPSVRSAGRLLDESRRLLGEAASRSWLGRPCCRRVWAGTSPAAWWPTLRRDRIPTARLRPVAQRRVAWGPSRAGSG